MKDHYYQDPGVAARYDVDEAGELGDVEFYASLARESAAAGLPVLELACGTGRVSIPIAREGVCVVGLDRSPAMLEVARRKSAGLDNVRWVEGDMADFELGERFGLVFIPHRSFLMLMTVAEQKSCLAEVRRHLAPGGRLALNFFNPDIVMMGRWLGERHGGLEALPWVQGAANGLTQRRWASRQVRTASQEVDETCLEDEVDESGAVVSRVYRNLRLRYVFRYEMEHLLALSGFEVEALYGGFQGEPFADASSEMVWVARRSEVE